MKQRLISMLFVLVCLVGQTFAQNRQVSGRVTAAGDAMPIAGATVRIEGGTQAVSSADDGRFTLAIPQSGTTLLVSSLGYAEARVAVGASEDNIQIALSRASGELEEVVVVGYGTQKKTTLTGAVSAIKGDDIARIPAPNVSHSIAGRLPGVSMRPNGGKPGADDPAIYVRGVVTTGNNSPLVVVDGVKRDNIRQVDPSAIATITILKDAAAVAPFGIGGANGVILITTKKGQSGRPTLRAGTSLGFQNPTYLPEVLDARDYMILQNEAYYNGTPNGTNAPFDADIVENYHALHQQDPLRYPSSHFLDLFNKDTPVQNHNLELGGGTENIAYRMGLGYYDQRGLFDQVGYRRYNYSTNLEANATSCTKVGISLHGSVERTNDLDGDARNTGQLFRSFYKYLPNQSLMYAGTDYWGESSANTPVGVLRSRGYSRSDMNTLLGSLFIEQKIADGLSARGVFSYDPSHTIGKYYHIPYTYHTIDLSTTPYSFAEAISNQEGNAKTYSWLEQESRRGTNYTWQGFLNYDRTFGRHQLTGLLVAEGRQRVADSFKARRENFALEIDELDLGSSDRKDFDNGGNSSSGSEIGYVYRVGYSFAEKYILEVAGRYDGHYYFAPGSRWGYFPSFSAAWRLSQEGFFDPLKELVGEFKLRGSWGKAGMLAGRAFQYQSGYTLSGNAYAFGSGSVVQGASVGGEPNPNITWEMSTKTNIGFDALLWGGRVNVEFDYFTERRTGMLLAPQVTLPVEYGLSLSQENKGEMANRGIEANVGLRGSAAGVSWSISANASYARNRMIEVFQSDADRDNPNRTRVDRPWQTPFGYKALGLFSTADDLNGDGKIDAADGYTITQFGTIRPGDIRYADLSGPDGVPDGKIDAHDQMPIGYPTYPEWTFGLAPSAQWKGLDLALFFQGSANASLNIRQFTTVPFENNASNTGYEYFNNRWTPDSQNARYPRATPSPESNNTPGSDFWYENAAYLRLKTLTLGYTLPRKLTERAHIGNLRLYLLANNLLTISKIKHMDPEGVHDTVYPLIKTTTIGLELTF